MSAIRDWLRKPSTYTSLRKIFNTGLATAASALLTGIFLGGGLGWQWLLSLGELVFFVGFIPTVFCGALLVIRRYV